MTAKDKAQELLEWYLGNYENCKEGSFEYKVSCMNAAKVSFEIMRTHSATSPVSHFYSEVHSILIPKFKEE